MKFKKGDTLVEVALAIGIFSMVAIAVVSVVNSSTSSAQSALEVTITREEIDAQAEALRFIHDSYSVGDDTGSASSLSSNTIYSDIWNKIISLARSVPLDGGSAELEYQPSTCEELYADDGAWLKERGAFIINTRNLAGKNVNEIVYAAKDNSGFFSPAVTYPRVLHSTTDKNQNTSSLIEQGRGSEFYGAEGIFVIPTKYERSAVIVTSSGAVNRTDFYDFYVRTCWFGPGADRPTTISTVVRLYDPKLSGF